MSRVVFDIECLEGKFVKELGVFKDGIILRYSFLPPKDFKTTFQVIWNPKNLHGINWSSGKLKYIELSSIIHQHCSSTTNFFAKGLEKCNLLSNYLCKDVENLDDFGCPKNSKLFKNLDTDWDCSNSPYRHKKTFYSAEKKAYAFGILTLDPFDNVLYL